jgi:hypothetical protein
MESSLLDESCAPCVSDWGVTIAWFLARGAEPLQYLSSPLFQWKLLWQVYVGHRVRFTAKNQALEVFIKSIHLCFGCRSHSERCLLARGTKATLGAEQKNKLHSMCT